MIDFSTRGYARKKNGRFKQSSLQRWRNRKKTFNDYVMPAVAVITVWSTVWLVDILPMAEAQSVITIENRQFSKVDAAESSSHGEEDNDTLVSAGVQSEERQGKPIKDVVRLSDDTIEGKIREAWIGTGMEDVAVAVAKSESGLRTDAMGWNCYYYNAQGKRYSKACLPQDREKAWSVDCGIMQINHIGKTCPAYLFDPDENIKIGKEKYDSSDKRIGIGFYPWMAYRNNLHLKYLRK